MFVRAVVSLATLSSVISLSSALAPRSNGLPLSSHLVHEFPNPTWVENIAVRSTGQLLLTIVTSPDVYYVDPASPSSATLITTFSTSIAHGVLGITEVKPDRFYVLSSKFSLSPLDPGFNTGIIHSIDLTSYDPATNTGAIVKTVTAVPRITFGNGVSTLDAAKNLIVVAESVNGTVWALDVETGKYDLLLSEPEMRPSRASPGFALGINGIRVLRVSADKVYIYFDNTSRSLFCRVPLSLKTLKKSGPVEILADLSSSALTTDDFALYPEEGVAYLACQQNSILRIPLEGGQAVDVLGGLNQTVVAGPTSVAIARGDNCEGKFYVTTNGGLAGPINGTYVEGGKVQAVLSKRWR